MTWSKRKFKIDKNLPAMRICEMNLEQATRAKEAFYKLSCAAGYADDGRRQNMWAGYEGEAEARIKELTIKEKHNGSNKIDRSRKRT